MTRVLIPLLAVAAVAATLLLWPSATPASAGDLDWLGYGEGVTRAAAEDKTAGTGAAGAEQPMTREEALERLDEAPPGAQPAVFPRQRTGGKTVAPGSLDSARPARRGERLPGLAALGQ